MAGDQRRGIGIHAGTHVRSFHAVAIARRRAPTSVDKTPCHPVGDRNNGTRLKRQWFVFLERNLDGHPLAGLLSERRLEEVFLRPNGRKSQNLGVSLRSPKITTVLFRICGRYQDGWKERYSGSCVEKSANRHLSGRTDPMLNQVYMGCTQTETEVDQVDERAKTHSFQRITATEVTNGKQNKRNNFSKPITAWSCDMEGHVEKCVEKVMRAYWKKRINIKAGGNVGHG